MELHGECPKTLKEFSVTWRKPWLWLPPQLAHDISPQIVKPLSRLRWNQKPYKWQPLNWKGLVFPNRLGIAGGVDKDAIGVEGWWRYGAGFVEVGTVTPAPQKANPGLKVLRDSENFNLWNQLGFPSKGSNSVKERLLEIRKPYPSPLFLNIGKNRETPLEEAHLDYHMLIQQFADHVDGFVINISSPNTKGLRQLLDPLSFKHFLERVSPPLNAARKPCWIKLSPDVEDKVLNELLDISLDFPIDGWVLTNTTLARPKSGNFPSHGGVSGSFLNERSLEVLKNTVSHLGVRKKDRLIVSVGGVMSPEDVQERLDSGADLVQVYSALIFHGPNFFKQVYKWQRRRK